VDFGSHSERADVAANDAELAVTRDQRQRRALKYA